MIGARLEKLLWSIPKKIPAHDQTYLVETDSCVVRVRDTGGGRPALVFFCDPPVVVEAYDELIALFENEFRVVIIEPPGFAYSKHRKVTALTFNGAVAAVEQALLSIDLGRCVLFGPCVCGFLATALVSRAALPITGLVLMQAPDTKEMLDWVKRMDPKGLLRIPVIGQVLVRATARRTSAFWMKYATAKAFDASDLSNKCDTVLADGGGYPLASMLQLWSSGTRDADLDIPTIAIWGKRDRSHPDTNPDCSLRHAKHAKVFEFDDCGHFSELEQPTQFFKTVKPFLDQWLSD